MIKKIFKKYCKAIISLSGYKKAWGNNAVVSEIPEEHHSINHNHISKNAIYVTQTLQQAGFKAFIVGGAVRDLILRLKPKDFDVSTNATPQQIQKLFPRAYLIGRRFQIIHVHFQREIIEVSTFRGSAGHKSFLHQYGTNFYKRNFAKKILTAIKQKTVKQIINFPKLPKKHRATYGQSINAHGQITKDNIWGSQKEDASRRDLTINAMYYDPTKKIIFDYHHGFEDIQHHIIKIIGNPSIRFREDPVRMLRIIRFASKLNFDISTDLIVCFNNLHHLLNNVSRARLFDETLKLFLNGHAQVTLNALKKFGLVNMLLPLLPNAEDSIGQKFISLLLSNTDQRLSEKNHVSAAFTLAGLLWPAVCNTLRETLSHNKNRHEALEIATQIVIDTQTEKLSIPKHYVSSMREIWMMQTKLENKQIRTVKSLLKHPKLRAGYDFLLLRSKAGEVNIKKALWWTTLLDATHHEREKLISELICNTK